MTELEKILYVAKLKMCENKLEVKMFGKEVEYIHSIRRLIFWIHLKTTDMITKTWNNQKNVYMDMARVVIQYLTAKTVRQGRKITIRILELQRAYLNDFN